MGRLSPSASAREAKLLPAFMDGPVSSMPKAAWTRRPRMAKRLGEAACAQRVDEHHLETLGVQGLMHRAVVAPGDCGWEE